MRRSKVTPDSVLTPVNYDRKTGVYNNPLTPVSLDQKTGEVTDPYHPAGYDSRSGMYYDGFAEGGGEYVTPKEFAQTYGLRALAEGGYVQAGEPVIVGDGGQSEYFVPDNGQQYQGNYQRMMDYINSGKPMDMAPQPAIPRSEEEMAGMYNTPIPKDREMDYERWKWDQSRQRGNDITKDLSTYDIQGAALAGMKRGGANMHFPDTFKKPSHEGFSTDSQYSGLDGYEGGRWGYNKDTQREVFTPADTNWMMNSRGRMMRYVNAPGEKPVELMENVGGKMMNVNVPGVYGLRALAQGGYVQQGEPVIVGDGGQPELFVPDQSGYVYPQVPQQVYRNARGDGMTQEELDRVTAMQSGGQGQKYGLSPQDGGFVSKDDYYAQKAADAASARQQQDRANWMMQPISQADVSAPEYGHKYYSTLGNQGPEAVAGLPVPKDYAPPIGISVTPEDRGIDSRRVQNGVGLSAMQGQPQGYPDLVQRGPMQMEPRMQAGGLGLSAMQGQDQGQQQIAPTQVQTAQAILGTVQNGTPRETIQAVMQATGMRGNIVPGKDGSIAIVGEDGRALHSFNGLQDVVSYAYKHLGDNSGLPDHYLSLDQKEARRKEQMKTNEKLVDYMAQVENRNYQRQADQERMGFNTQAKIDEYNRSLASMYGRELDAAQKAWNTSNPGEPFNKAAFDASFDAGLAKFGVSPKGQRQAPQAPTGPQSDWSGLPVTEGTSSQVGLGRPATQQNIPQQPQQRQDQGQQSPQTQQWGSLKELQAAVSGGQIPRAQAEQYAQQQGWIRPSAAPAQTAPVQAAPAQTAPVQQQAPSVGLSAMQQDQSPPVPYLDNPGQYVPNAEGTSTYSPYAQGNAIRRVVTKPETSRLAQYLAALKAKGGDAAVEQYLRYANQAGSGRRPYGNGR